MWGSSDGRFFRSHSWRGRLRPVFRVRPIPLSFWGNVPPLQWGHSFAWLTHLRLHRYHLIFTGYWLSAIRSRSLSEVGRCRDNRVSYFRAKVYGLVVQVTHPLSPCIVYNSPQKQKIPPEEQNLRFALRRDVFRHDCYKFKKALDLKSTLRIILNLSEKFLPLLCGRHDDKGEFTTSKWWVTVFVTHHRVTILQKFGETRQNVKSRSNVTRTVSM